MWVYFALFSSSHLCCTSSVLVPVFSGEGWNSICTRSLSSFTCRIATPRYYKPWNLGERNWIERTFSRTRTNSGLGTVLHSTAWTWPVRLPIFSRALSIRASNLFLPSHLEYQVVKWTRIFLLLAASLGYFFFNAKNFNRFEINENTV